MIKWTGSIKKGTDKEVVKQNQPNYLEIDWSNPDTINDRIRYEIINIKGNRDMLKMQNFVVFVDDKYVGRDAIK